MISWLCGRMSAGKRRRWRAGSRSQPEPICGVSELIAAASEIVTLEPGDVISTGTPAGVGAGRGRFLRGGDIVRTNIDGLGALENHVIDSVGG